MPVKGASHAAEVTPVHGAQVAALVVRRAAARAARHLEIVTGRARAVHLREIAAHHDPDQGHSVSAGK